MCVNMSYTYIYIPWGSWVMHIWGHLLMSLFFGWFEHGLLLCKKLDERRHAHRDHNHMSLDDVSSVFEPWCSCGKAAADHWQLHCQRDVRPAFLIGEHVVLPWFSRCKDQTPVPDGSRPPFQTYDPDPFRPQRPWILISFAVKYLWSNYGISYIVIMYLHVLGRFHSLSSPSIPFFATKAWVASLEMQGPSYNIHFFFWGIISSCNPMFFMTQSLAPSKIHEEASGIWFCTPSNCQHALCKLVSSWFLHNLHLYNNDDVWCCPQIGQYLQQDADKYASLGSAWSVIHGSEHTTGPACHSLGWTLCKLLQIHLLADLKDIFQLVPSDQKTHSAMQVLAHSSISASWICARMVSKHLVKKTKELCHSKLEIYIYIHIVFVTKSVLTWRYVLKILQTSIDTCFRHCTCSRLGS